MKKAKSKKILKYDVVFEEAEEGGYTVYVPALPGCISEGDTFEEAKKNIKDAITLYLESVEMDRKSFAIDKSSYAL
ncbi:antitoxin HicB [Candidatus Roizmanbacteria bacterium RIFCSPLOWO2_01_FULL_37_13]|uniref:Antitoxin HicB n=1 Tax=Candidatus Roizmanbacteria bacterium RIFCSPHIGHO2_02_FULL_38_11 TaxID=1802039 RepID=A0A1F7GXX7_9BACT|nr:MAG: antitoxin HicB [Candidatus Roizmanbacteria bacterium RIFCSPHIGHO2_02_FULL_38_11]OGK33070.1 MAG: antitoxin HicB [Candidatus Roizmanbacteria bacterium RIFCSPHIGHO2_12_FULL_37_9b]OGK43128.1 MAG: antitoxin HicB [Candidatus Roizmanbacteria bacterium RIFCSPLOWO2_01_FULL_37_13]